MMKNIEKIAKKYQTVENITKELRNLQTKKSRLKKQKSRKDYDSEMTKILQNEQLLKEARQYLAPKKTFVTNFTINDIKLLNYDETVKAIKSIQSKKCNSQWLPDTGEFDRACQIEQMLLEHKMEIKPIEDTVVKKSQIKNLMDNLAELDKNVDKDYILKQLKELL